jgi:DNA modification methylase
VTDYNEFLQQKRQVMPANGMIVAPEAVHPALFDFQRQLVLWSVRKGRAALFVDTGLGKTLMQLEWARLLGGRALILAPLSVAKQTVNEAKRLLALDVHYTRAGSDLADGINITNYEMADYFDAADFNCIALDESSILKAFDGKTKRRLIDKFGSVPYRACYTATPAPNDLEEIGNHAEFLGVMTRADMLASFFVHDDEGWRIKGHARTAFYRWLSSWAMSVRKPSDIGYGDDGYNLPPLDIQPQYVSSEYVPEGQLFFTGLKGVGDRAQVRRGTLEARLQRAAEILQAVDGQAIAWCALNDEADGMAALLPDAVNVKGSMSPEEKQAAIEAWQRGDMRILISKPTIAGYGMNFQNAADMVFVGLGDSFEQYYQCIRRCWRFGQTKPVTVHIVLSEIEDAIYQNVQRKEREAAEMSEQLIEHVRSFEREELEGISAEDYVYITKDAHGDNWRLMLGDSCERLKELESDSVGLSVFSPPFQSLYSYSPTERDLGNSKDADEFYQHFGFIIGELLRVTKPGRSACVHVAQVPAMLSRDGYIGLKDFRGDVIRAFEAQGWIYDGEVCIDKDPQAQAIRTKAKALLFTQLHKDSSWSRPALADYIVKFRKPGENADKITPDISNEEWIQWARPIWYGIKESDTLQYQSAREADDERHICPLQLGTIERCIRLWSNKGDLVLSPFAGIGSEGYEAVRLGRRFVGIELKSSYFNVAVRNLQKAEAQSTTPDVFTLLAEMAKKA